MANVGLKIKDLPESERPRERLLQRGVSSLSSSELLSLVIAQGAPGEPATYIAQRLISEFVGLGSLGKASFNELMSINGIGVAKACQLLACFELARRISGAPVIRSMPYKKSKDFFSLVKPHLTTKTKEHFIIISLDSRYRLISIDNISIGTVNQTIVHPREVFKAAINRRACYIVLAHNHPSGDYHPSNDDYTLTQQLVEVSHMIGIPIIDHIIVAGSGYLSFKDEEYMPAYMLK